MLRVPVAGRRAIRLLLEVVTEEHVGVGAIAARLGRVEIAIGMRRRGHCREEPQRETEN